MSEKFGLPFTSANVRDPETGALILPEYLVFERAGIRFGICSVTDPSYKFITLSGDDAAFDVDDPTATLRELIPRLREEVDTVILLSHLGDRGTEQLLRDVSGIDAAIVGHTMRVYKNERVISDTVLLAAAHEGRYIGRADIYVAPQDGKFMGVDVSTTSLDDAIADDPEILQSVDEFKQHMAELKLARRAEYPRDLGSDQAHFLGETACKSCHEDVYESYSTTTHRSAFSRLRAMGMNHEPECLNCHTTGYRYHGGFDDKKGAIKLASVQCEACHGYGTDHTRSGEYLSRARDSCLECHDTQNGYHADDGFEFDYASYWQQISH
jgi:hypothetical protein